MLFATLQAMDACLHLRVSQDVGLKCEELSCGFKSLGEMGLDKSSSSSAAHVAQVGHHFMSVATIKQFKNHCSQVSWN